VLFTHRSHGYRANVDTGTGIEPAVDLVALRRCVLAVSVLRDLDLVPTDEGVLTGSGRLVPWPAVAAGLEGADPDSPAARPILATWLRAVHGLSWRSPADIMSRARPVGLPAGHALHPGADWVLDRVRGGVLDLGLGLAGIGDDPDSVLVPRSGVLEACGVDPRTWWPQATEYLDRMGDLAAVRFRRDGSGKPLRPMGDCDVVTLVGSPALRAEIVASDSIRMRAAAVPTRNRGWLDLTRTDPAFVLVAASLAAPEDRGFERPLLITADEITMVRPGGDPVLQALRDAAAPDPVAGAVLIR
jgi:hypothetical protein